MGFLKISIFIIFFLIYGCSSYKVIVDKDGVTKVIGTPDRFLPYCERVVKDDDTVSYGFMILFLDEEKTVGTATGMLTSQKACLKWEKSVREVLENGTPIILSGFGNMTKPRVVERFSHTFEKHGTYYDNGRSMDFFYIRNHQGHCFSVNPDRCL